MAERRYRVLLVATHPVQYSAPVFRQMTHHPHLDIEVAYCSLHNVNQGTDPEFGMSVRWDLPLLEGYPWVEVANKSPRPGLGRFFGLLNPGLWKLVRKGGFDAVVSFTGYNYASFWILAFAAKVHGKPFLFGTDAYDLHSRDGRAWKLKLKRRVWPKFFRLADVVIVLSSGGVALMRSLGIPAERIALTPFVVNNEWWLAQSQRADPAATRREWRVPDSASVALFCAKLQLWKRPQDVLRAFAKAKVPEAFLIYAGEGPLRGSLESEATTLGVAERVRFLGFANQSQLPSIYAASDLFVLPSEYEPFGVVVNEAMLCGCAVAVSDRVGARFDLVQPGETGYVYSCSDVDALAKIFSETLPDREGLKRMGEAARNRMQTWSPREYIDALFTAVTRATGQVT